MGIEQYYTEYLRHAHARYLKVNVYVSAAPVKKTREMDEVVTYLCVGT